ncbi:MAG: hypothetical protein K2H13_04595 [Eubacterium sp.]|nr:hypothetical protein [Eubacterium sp.]
MKKLLAIAITAAICISLASCTKEQMQEESTQPITQPTTAITTTTEPATSTTAAPSEDTQKGAKLKTAVLAALDNEEKAIIEGNLSCGSFTYKFIRDAKIQYENERSEEFAKTARQNADSLVEEIKELYGDEITFNREYAAPIGSGDNGIDSVQYQFFYLNTQNQQLKIFADSDGIVCYAECNFTW